MPAIIYDVEADEGRDFDLTFVWFNNEGERIDLTDYGALCEVRTPDGELVARVTHADSITLTVPDDPFETPEDVGKIIWNIPAVKLDDPVELECEYEFIVHPDGDDPSDRPVDLLRGLFTIRQKIASLDPPS